jgi:hypothetical protein
MLYAIIDPGVTTGFLLIDADPRILPLKIRVLKAVEIKNFEEVCDTIYQLASTVDKDALTVIYEKFVIQHQARHTEPMEIIGVIKFIHRHFNFKLIGQVPASQHGPKQKLDDLRIMYKKFPHISSCLFHMCYFFIYNYHSKDIVIEHQGFLEKPLVFKIL